MDGITTRVEYQVAIRRDSDGSYWAEVEQLPGCFASGDTIEEVQDNLIEAIGIYLSTPESRVEMSLVASDPTEQTSTQSFKVLADA
jgi:predicted RNase H-like HicB family nuclease